MPRHQSLMSGLLVFYFHLLLHAIFALPLRVARFASSASPAFSLADTDAEKFEFFFLLIQRKYICTFPVHYVGRQWGICISARDRCWKSFVFDKLRIFQFFADRTSIGGRDIHGVSSFIPGIPELHPNLFMADRDHLTLAHQANLLLFDQGIYLYATD